jgi:sulfur-carrier protein
MIRVELPFHLRKLANVDNEVTVDVQGAVTQRAIIDAIEARFPMLRGTIRDYATGQRKPFLRFFGCQEDLSFAPPDAPVPDPIARGAEPFMIVGALSGG